MQGIVFETLDLSQLPDYKVGGCIHLVVNNQVAFTTDPKASRSSPYCTDLAKAIDAPIFHVNGDDVESVVRVCQLAADWRQTWGGDVVVDLVCYRKHGHNEIDEPMYTQPLMYNVRPAACAFSTSQLIYWRLSAGGQVPQPLTGARCGVQVVKKHKNSFQKYIDRLLAEGTVSEDEVSEVQNRVLRILQEEFDLAKEYTPQEDDWLSSVWTGFKTPAQRSRIRNTGVSLAHSQPAGH